MTFKNMFLLGGVLAGAAYLQNKSRRDRLMTQGRDLLDKAKTRAADITHKVESKLETRTGDSIASTKRDNGVSTSPSTASSTYGGAAKSGFDRTRGY